MKGSVTATGVGAFRNIICGVDFSPASEAALETAFSLATQSRGRVTLLHVLDGYPYESVYSASRALRMIGEYGARVSRVSRWLRSAVPSGAGHGVDVDTEVVTGVPHDAIVATAVARDADLIVIGASSRTMLHRLVMGSTAAAVLRHAGCAVLTVPASSRVVERAA